MITRNNRNIENTEIEELTLNESLSYSPAFIFHIPALIGSFREYELIYFDVESSTEDIYFKHIEELFDSSAALIPKSGYEFEFDSVDSGLSLLEKTNNIWLNSIVNTNGKSSHISQIYSPDISAITNMRYCDKEFEINTVTGDTIKYIYYDTGSSNIYNQINLNTTDVIPTSIDYFAKKLNILLSDSVTETIGDGSNLYLVNFTGGENLDLTFGLESTSSDSTFFDTEIYLQSSNNTSTVNYRLSSENDGSGNMDFYIKNSDTISTVNKLKMNKSKNSIEYPSLNRFYIGSPTGFYETDGMDSQITLCLTNDNDSDASTSIFTKGNSYIGFNGIYDDTSARFEIYESSTHALVLKNNHTTTEFQIWQSDANATPTAGDALINTYKMYYSSATSKTRPFYPTGLDTSGSAANVYIDANGQLFESTSSRKYKENISLFDDYIDPSYILELELKKFTRKSSKAIEVGYIAEEVCEKFLKYNKSQNPNIIVSFEKDGREIRMYNTNMLIFSIILFLKQNFKKKKLFRKKKKDKSIDIGNIQLKILKERMNTIEEENRILRRRIKELELNQVKNNKKIKDLENSIDLILSHLK